MSSGILIFQVRLYQRSDYAVDFCSIEDLGFFIAQDSNKIDSSFPDLGIWMKQKWNCFLQNIMIISIFTL